MKLPCQMIVWDVLPAIRAAIAEELINCGLSQQEVAKQLDMAPSAVSQYLSKKRGYRIVLEDDMKASIRELAEDMKENRVDDLASRICAICKQLREEGQQCSND
ncbi:helix-turn-helix domain-containing protein [Methanolobus sediminis]|uniref:Helix-turn-helix domain-containing protein n=1 Tax=Methanolobus sediminis TaxID=3072978 RepID=A0AA51ULZ7_9EURY|nr:helix-turn-helix domain-containing protein [Methanolobus sediminis]WMW25727.1 helix-turn-helix domain-containing protein [Methanolobus sediminis]